MFSRGQKKGMCGHIMALFDGHLKCARCRDKGVGDNPCVLKRNCPICKAFTPEQILQLATPPTERGRIRKRRWALHRSVCWDGWTEKTVKKSETPAGKKKRTDESPKPSSKKSKSSSKPSSDELRDLDEKWGECFARLKAMLLSKTLLSLWSL